MSKNKIGSRGIFHVAFAMKQGSNIEVLNVSNNEISAKGCQELSDALLKCPTLTKLDISCNTIFEKGMGHLAGTSLFLLLFDFVWLTVFCRCLEIQHNSEELGHLQQQN
jgi:uncharacterized protein (AIM24 family)